MHPRICSPICKELQTEPSRTRNYRERNGPRLVSFLSFVLFFPLNQRTAKRANVRSRETERKDDEEGGLLFLFLLNSRLFRDGECRTVHHRVTQQWSFGGVTRVRNEIGASEGCSFEERSGINPPGRTYDFSDSPTVRV